MTTNPDYPAKRLGWCPGEDARRCNVGARGNIMIQPSPGRDIKPGIPVGWMSRYRNWLLFWALFYIAFSMFYLPLFLTAEGNYVLMVIAGIAIASLVFLMGAKRLWRQYDEILAGNRLEESETKRNLILYLVVSAVILLVGFEMLVFLGSISGIDFLVLPAFMVGFSVIPWFTFWLVVAWESMNGCRLYRDGKGLSAIGGINTTIHELR
ncbi:MAG: DUF1673 domain-containing protein [Methanolinea sp.]|nr:DUF1673 domain-containing protein [Methanolinea sp.]